MSALRHSGEIPPVQLTSMADFATWIWRACPGLGWDAKAFLNAYDGNKNIGAEIVFEADGLGAAVAALLALRKLDGTARGDGQEHRPSYSMTCPSMKKGARRNGGQPRTRCATACADCKKGWPERASPSISKTRDPGHARPRLITIT